MEQHSDVSPADVAVKTSTIGSRLVDIFVSPGEVFDGLRNAPKSTGNWLVPLILAIVVSIVTIFVVFSQPTIQQQMIDVQHNQMAKQVQTGKMTQEQMTQAESMIPKPGSLIWNIIGIFGAIIVTIIIILLIALVLWLIGKFVLKAPLKYGAMLEITGLSYMVMVLGSIISILTILALDSLYATPSLAIMIKEYNVENGIHKLLSQMNIFSIWFVALLGIGLAKICNVATMKGMIWTFGIFVVFILAIAFVF
jgi:hypothetical protein